MSQVKERVAAIEGWFTISDTPALLGTRCSACGTYFFPRKSEWCANPDCLGRDLEEVELSRTGRIWSFTDNRYQPPAPYVSTDPFEPYTIAAVELHDEHMVVLGQMEKGTDLTQLQAGHEVEVTLGTLYEDDEHEYLVWNWKLVKP